MAYKSYVLIPSTGRGMISSRSTQNLKEYSDSWSFLQNFIFTDEAVTVRPGDLSGNLANDIAAATGPRWGIHYYNAIDPTDASATPTTIMFVHAGEAVAGTGTSTLYDSNGGGTIITVNGNNFTTTDPSDIFFLNIKNRCFITGRKMGAGVIPTVVQKYPSHASYAWGKTAPTADLTYDTYTNATNAFTKVVFQANGAGVTNGSTTVTKVGGPNWDGGTAWVGKTIYLSDVPYTIVSYTPTTGPMTISQNYADATATVNMRVQYGELTWPNQGPQYAYAYYNPTTGHISSISPVLTVTEQTLSNVRVKLSNIMLTNDSQYTRVVIFRTALDNGGVLYPLLLDTSGTNPGSASVDGNVGTAGYGMIQNTSVGAVTYVDFQSDTNLGQILGLLPAPQFNDPPPTDAKLLAYWDERVWTVSASNPYQLRFSGNSAQNPLGVPEECFPALNFRPTPSGDDGAILSLKVVGSNLLVGTNKYLYFVSGSNESDYALTRVSSRGSGIDQYAIDEHPGDSSEQAASAIYLSRDRRLWRQYPGGRIDDIGWPIQDKLDLIDMNKNKPAIVKVFQVGKVCMLAMGVRAAGNTRYDYLFYDFDKQTWHDMGFASGIFGAGYTDGTGALTPWSATASGIDYHSNVSGVRAFHIGSATTISQLMVDGSTLITGGCTGSSQWIDAGDKESKKTLQEVVLHVTAPANVNWYVTAYFDDDDTTGYSMTAQSDSGTPRQMGAGVIRYVLPTTVARIQWRTLKVKIQFTAGTVGSKLYKAIINYTVASTGSAGAHS